MQNYNRVAPSCPQVAIFRQFLLARGYPAISWNETVFNYMFKYTEFADTETH